MSKKFQAVPYLEIVDAVNRFMIYADHQEWDEVRQLMMNSVWVDFADLDRAPAGRVDSRILISSWRDQANGLEAVQHLLSNHYVDLSAKDKATCRAHAQIYRTLANNKGASYWLLGGTYLFGLVRLGGAWKVERIAWETLWSAGNASIFELAYEKAQENMASKPLSTDNPLLTFLTDPANLAHPSRP